MRTFCGLTTDGMLDYLAEIYRLGGEHDRVTTGLLAESMAVSPPAVSSMLRRLEESNLVARSTADGVTLTEQGERAALQLIRRHRLLEVFLVQVMDFTWDQVDLEAQRLEHAISDAFELRIEQLCGFPTQCPHGDPIPGRDGRLELAHTVRLPEAPLQQPATLLRVTSRDPGMLRYLARLGMMPGSRVAVQDIAPFQGPITVRIGNGSGQETHVLGRELAQFVHVQMEGESG